MAWGIITRAHGIKQPQAAFMHLALAPSSCCRRLCQVLLVCWQHHTATPVAELKEFLLASDVMSAHWQPSTFLLQWMKSISKTQLLEKDDPVYEWRERVFKQFEDTISKAHMYPA